MIRVLIVDDSHFMQTVLKNILESAGDIKVIGFAGDGKEAVEKTKELKPDVVTLDVMMPSMDGLETLREIMKTAPTRVLMISAADRESADIAVKCVENGAIGFISKPKGSISTGMHSIGDEIIESVRQASAVEIGKLRGKTVSAEQKNAKKTYESAGVAVSICASLGGIPSVEKVVLPIRESRASFFLVQHMVPEVVESFAARLDSLSAMYVKVAEAGEVVRGNVLYVAPGDMHMRISGGRIVLSREERVNGVRPSADVLFASIADEYGANAIGITLSGTGRDGAAGLKRMHERGAFTVAESPDSALAFNMPRSAIDMGAIDLVLRAEEIHRMVEEKLDLMVSRDG